MAGSFRTVDVRRRFRNRPLRAGCLILALSLAAGCAGRSGGPQPAGAAGEGTVVVAQGDTVYGIARRSHVAIRDLIELNRLEPPYVLQVGQHLALPTQRVHVVETGETLLGIAGRYGVDPDQLRRVNELPPPYIIRVGQVLRLPGAAPTPTVAMTPGPRPAISQMPLPSDPASRPPGPAVPPAAQPMPAAFETATPPAGSPPRTAIGSGAPSTITVVAPRPRTDQAATGQGTIPPQTAAAVPAPAVPPGVAVPAAAAAPAVPAVPTATTVPAVRAAPAAQAAPPASADAAPPPRGGSQFLWPVKGKVVSRYGPKPDGVHNDGINIAAARGASVIAAENGVVVYSGNELKGYGNLLLVRHADGWITAYAHLDQMVVKRGATVRRGQRIGTVGSTGSVNTPQLHFEVRRGSQAVDPKQHLAGT